MLINQWDSRAKLLRARKVIWGTVIAYALVITYCGVSMWAGISEHKVTFFEETIAFVVVPILDVVTIGFGCWMTRDINRQLRRDDLKDD